MGLQSQPGLPPHLFQRLQPLRFFLEAFDTMEWILRERRSREQIVVKLLSVLDELDPKESEGAQYDEGQPCPSPFC